LLCANTMRAGVRIASGACFLAPFTSSHVLFYLPFPFVTYWLVFGVKHLFSVVRFGLGFDDKGGKRISAFWIYPRSIDPTSSFSPPATEPNQEDLRCIPPTFFFSLLIWFRSARLASGSRRVFRLGGEPKWLVGEPGTRRESSRGIYDGEEGKVDEEEEEGLRCRAVVVGSWAGEHNEVTGRGYRVK